MTMSYDEMIAVLQAAKEGKKIQWRWPDGVWYECNSIVPDWNFGRCEYRVKPEPRTIWVNEYLRGWGWVNDAESEAACEARIEHPKGRLIRQAVKFVEVIE